MNKLIHETSPYLQQHANNPVEWYPWGPEAIEKSRREDKPIFLSIGYSASHWCHVMAHESFEDPDNPLSISLIGKGAKVDVISPNGGEVWKVGTTNAITWQTKAGLPVAKVNLFYTTGGGTWNLIRTVTGNLELLTGKYLLQRVQIVKSK